MLTSITDFTDLTIKGNCLSADNPLLGKWMFRLWLQEGLFVVAADSKEEAMQEYRRIQEEAASKNPFAREHFPPRQIELAGEIERLCPKEKPVTSTELDVGGMMLVLQPDGHIVLGFRPEMQKKFQPWVK